MHQGATNGVILKREYHSFDVSCSRLYETGSSLDQLEGCYEWAGGDRQD